MLASQFGHWDELSQRTRARSRVRQFAIILDKRSANVAIQ